jgi:hypothetical protein
MREMWRRLIGLIGVMAASAAVKAQCQLEWKAAPGNGLVLAPGEEFLWASAALEGQIVLGGLFASVGSTKVNNITRWNGQAWEAMGQGLTSPVPYDVAVRELMVVDGALWACGVFDASGPVALPGLARWNGASWEAIEHGMSGPVTAMGMYQDQPVIARWDEATKSASVARRVAREWVPLGESLNLPINALVEYAGDWYLGGGDRDTGESMFRRWTGAAWEELVAPWYPVREFAQWNDQLVIASDYIGMYGIGRVDLWDGSKPQNIGQFEPDFDWLLFQQVASFQGHLFEGSTGAYSGSPSPKGVGILEWTGSTWIAPAGGVKLATNDFTHVSEFLELDGELHVFGAFTKAGNLDVLNWAIMACACPADCDASGSLNIDDFICFQTQFAVGSASADCDGDGALSIDDFICFQTHFAIGC